MSLFYLFQFTPSQDIAWCNPEHGLRWVGNERIFFIRWLWQPRQQSELARISHLAVFRERAVFGESKEASRLWRMRPRIQGPTRPPAAHLLSYWGKTIQVPAVQQTVHTAISSTRARGKAHRIQGLRLRHLREGFCSEVQPEAPHGPAHRWETSQVQGLRQELSTPRQPPGARRNPLEPSVVYVPWMRTRFYDQRRSRRSSEHPYGREAVHVLGVLSSVSAIGQS